MEPSQTIYVVDDDAAVCRALANAGRLLGYPVRGFDSPLEFLAERKPSDPGCLVLDFKMPQMSGLDLQRKLADEEDSIPVVMISGHADVRVAVEAMTLGAVTLLEKPFRLDDLLKHLRQALEKDLTTRAAKSRFSEAESRFATLTAKEREVLNLVIAGKTNKEMAEALNLSIRSVEDRRARLMRKVQVRSSAELVQFIQQLRPAEPPL